MMTSIGLFAACIALVLYNAIVNSSGGGKGEAD
jgi:biopolymer transport protein ExbB/TolQ